MKDRIPFFTGSRVYGKPTDESDLDIVMLVSELDREVLKEFGSLNRDHKVGEDLSVRFGMLNVIIVINEQEYDAWRDATDNLFTMSVESGPVGRDEVVLEIDKQYQAKGIWELRKLESRDSK